MSIKETSRAFILQDVKSGIITLKEASNLLLLSYPQTKRVWSQFKKKGLKGLISKKRGRPSNRAVPKERRDEIAKIVTENYWDCKPLFVSEKLEERHQINYSSEFVRQLMIEYHLWVPNRKRNNIHQRRTRRRREGELVQMDASDHAWFEERGPRCHLHLLVDDATSKIYGGYFTLEETTEGYFRACFPYFMKKGLPISFYNDKRGTFKVNQGDQTGLTQFGRAMRELGINMIFAHSPEAKGRVERAFGTLQDRLVWEMRIENISTIEEANEFLPKFIEKHNEKYSIQPFSSSNAHRPLNHSTELKYILCKKTQRTVTKNLEVQFENTTYQLFVSKELQKKLKRAKVDVITTLDNEVRIEHKGCPLEFKRFNEIPYENLEGQVDPVLNEQTMKEKPKSTPRGSKIYNRINSRGHYITREEMMSPKEKFRASARLKKRKDDARRDNLEILAELREGTMG